MIHEFLAFLRREKTWWILPLALAAVILAAILLLTDQAQPGPFLYPSL